MKKTANPINHPYMSFLQSTLQTHKQLLECYEKRMSLISIGSASKNEYEKNEIQITRIKTQSEIDICKRVIKEKEDYFVKFMNQFVVDLDECEKNFDSLLQRAKFSSDAAIMNILHAANYNAIHQNAEVKIHFYKRLKKLLE